MDDAPRPAIRMRPNRGCSGRRRSTLADGRERFGVVQRAKPAQQRHRGVERAGRRRLEPLQRARLATPAEDVEHHRRQIHARDLRLPMRPQAIAGVPQAKDRARLHAPGAARPADPPNPATRAPFRGCQWRDRRRSVRSCAVQYRRPRRRPAPSASSLPGSLRGRCAVHRWGSARRPARQRRDCRGAARRERSREYRDGPHRDAAFPPRA